MLLEEFLQQPGFIYEIDGKYYFLGKWICKECTELDATDSSIYVSDVPEPARRKRNKHVISRKSAAYSDFALEVPYNPEKIKSDMQAILETLSDENTAALSEQLAGFKKDLAKYCE